MENSKLLFICFLISLIGLVPASYNEDPAFLVFWVLTWLAILILLLLFKRSKQVDFEERLLAYQKVLYPNMARNDGAKVKRKKKKRKPVTKKSKRVSERLRDFTETYIEIH